MVKIYTITIYYKNNKRNIKAKKKLKIGSKTKDYIYTIVDELEKHNSSRIGIDFDLIGYFVLGVEYL